MMIKFQTSHFLLTFFCVFTHSVQQEDLLVRTANGALRTIPSTIWPHAQKLISLSYLHNPASIDLKDASLDLYLTQRARYNTDGNNYTLSDKDTLQSLIWTAHNLQDVNLYNHAYGLYAHTYLMPYIESFIIYSNANKTPSTDEQEEFKLLLHGLPENETLQTVFNKQFDQLASNYLKQNLSTLYTFKKDGESSDISAFFAENKTLYRFSFEGLYADGIKIAQNFYGILWPEQPFLRSKCPGLNLWSFQNAYDPETAQRLTLWGDNDPTTKTLVSLPGRIVDLLFYSETELFVLWYQSSEHRLVLSRLINSAACNNNNNSNKWQIDLGSSIYLPQYNGFEFEKVFRKLYGYCFSHDKITVRSYDLASALDQIKLHQCAEIEFTKEDIPYCTERYPQVLMHPSNTFAIALNDHGNYFAKDADHRQLYYNRLDKKTFKTPYMQCLDTLVLATDIAAQSRYVHIFDAYTGIILDNIQLDGPVRSLTRDTEEFYVIFDKNGLYHVLTISDTQATYLKKTFRAFSLFKRLSIREQQERLKKIRTPRILNKGDEK
jgi:hypothetical protein